MSGSPPYATVMPPSDADPLVCGNASTARFTYVGYSRHEQIAPSDHEEKNPVHFSFTCVNLKVIAVILN